jgi:hypothetical protein
MPFDPWNTDDPDDWSLPPSSSAQGPAQPTFGAQSNASNLLLTSALPFLRFGTAPSTFSGPANPFNPLLTNTPPSFAAFGTAPSAFNPRPSPFNPVFTNLLPPSDPLSPYFGLSPADRLPVGASPPPTFPDAFGRFPPPPPLSSPAPPLLPAGSIFSDALKMLAERSGSASGGLFDAPANPQPAASSPQASAPSASFFDALAPQSLLPRPSSASPIASTPPSPINPLLTAPALPPFDFFSPYYNSSSANPLSTPASLSPTFPDAFGRFPPQAFPPAPPPLPSVGLVGNIAQTGGSPRLFGARPFPLPANQLAGSGLTPDLAQGLMAAPSSLQTTLPQPIGSQLNLSSPSQSGSPAPANGRLRSGQMINGLNGPPVQVDPPPIPYDRAPAPANGKLRSDQMINGLNGSLVQVAPPPSPFDQVTQALSDSWNSLKSLLDEPLSGGPFTFGDFLAALPLPGDAAGLAAVSRNYRATFFKAYPALRGLVTVHHAIERQVLNRYPGLFTEAEIHALENLRGIPNELNSDLHLKVIGGEWRKFYLQYPNATKEQLLQKAAEIDAKYGSQFNPPIALGE